MFRVDGNNQSNRSSETTERPPRVETVQFREPEKPVVNSRASENSFQNDIFKFTLNRQVDALLPTDDRIQTVNASPHEALDQINQLPVPSLNDPVATRAYQQQRADIADTALQNAVPPNRADFNALPPRLADVEYSDARSFYDSNIGALRNISTAANADLQAEPTAILGDPAQRVWDAAKSDPQAGAQTLAREIETLNAKYGPEAGGQLIAQLYQDSKNDPNRNLNNILTFGGGEETGGFDQAGLPEAQRDSIGTAIGQAYDQMSPTDRTDFVNGLVTAAENDGFRGNFLGGDTARIADLIARGNNATLKTDMVDALTKRMIEIQPRLLGNNGGVDIKALANSAAVIAAGGADSAAQTAMFNRIITSFPQMDGGQLESLMEDPTLKDNLSKVFINNSEAIVKSLTNEAGGLLDANSSDGLRQFFEMAMFSKNPGELREQVMGEAVKVISQFADPLAAATAGRTKADDARTAGSLIGLVQAAALKQKGVIEDDQKSREETTKMFVGMAFAFAPGASEALGEGSGKLLEFAYGKAVEYAQSNTESGFSKVINDLTDGDSLENISEGFKAVRDLRYRVLDSLDGEENNELYNAFESGYTGTGVDQLFVEALGE